MNVEEFHLLKRLLHHGFWNGLAVWIAALRSLYRHHVIGGSEFCGQKSRTKDEGETLIHNSDSFQSFASRGIYPRPSQIRISFYYGLGALRRAREGRTLLKNLRENIFECYRCAEACRHNATEQRNPVFRQDFLDCERRWLLLARGCEQEQAEHTKAFQQAAYFKTGCVI